MGRKILVADDDGGLVEMITYNLKQNGYQVTTAADGIHAFDLALQEKPDLIILDVMMPGMNGLELCSRLRQESSTATIPIIMLTARMHEIDKVAGLETGADDYVVKPFSGRELLARVRAVLRRANYSNAPRPQPVDTALQLVAGPVRIDLAARHVFCRGQEVELQPKQFDLLVYFVRHRGVVLTRDQLLMDVWGEDYEGGVRTVDVHVRWLREKLEEDPANPQLIRTMLRVGYYFS